MNCISCGVETFNPKFCSRGCAAQANNKTPKRRRSKKCFTCDTLVLHDRKYCKPCYTKSISVGDMTLQQAKDRYGKHYKTAAFSLVTSRAREIGKQNNMTSCSYCGYAKHVEMCHIRAISKFPMDTLISVVNALSNLIALCPNCHWEFDHPPKIKTIYKCRHCQNETTNTNYCSRSCSAASRQKAIRQSK